jgi:hypothetical protein
VTGALAPGRTATLTEQQTVLFKNMWMYVLNAMEVVPNDIFTFSTLAPVSSNSTTATTKSFRSFRKRRGLFRKKPKTCADPDVFRRALKSVTTEELRTCLLFMARHENIDNVLLRHLRHKNWDVTKALEGLGKTIHWRVKVFQVDKLLAEGEEHAYATCDEGLILQYKLPKAVIHGVDKMGRPTVTINVRKHDPNAQSEAAIERYTVQVIETIKSMFTEHADTANIIFDMRDFSLKNMDYAAVKFILKCIQNYYPDSLGFILIHKAPWIFATVWDIIKNWIDPDVANKISFTRNDKDLLQFIDPDQIAKDLGGAREYEYRYIPPQEGENDLIKDSETRYYLLEERQELADQLYEATAAWVRSAYNDGLVVDSQRQQILHKLSESYWSLDPFIRARTVYDRDGTFVQFQPASKLHKLPRSP